MNNVNNVNKVFYALISALIYTVYDVIATTLSRG